VSYGGAAASWTIARDLNFYNYRDPAVPLSPDNIESYRYHPLPLNAAFLGNLTPEDQSILGLGDKTNIIPAFERKPGHEAFQAWQVRMFGAKVVLEELGSRVAARLRRILRAG